MSVNSFSCQAYGRVLINLSVDTLDILALSRCDGARGTRWRSSPCLVLFILMAVVIIQDGVMANGLP